MLVFLLGRHSLRSRSSLKYDSWICLQTTPASTTTLSSIKNTIGTDLWRVKFISAMPGSSAKIDNATWNLLCHHLRIMVHMFTMTTPIPVIVSKNEFPEGRPSGRRWYRIHHGSIVINMGRRPTQEMEMQKLQGRVVEGFHQILWIKRLVHAVDC